MPQLINFYLVNYTAGGSINLTSAPKLFEIEINGEWYARQTALTEPTEGIDEGHVSSFSNLLLDDKWLRKSDNKPLILNPGKYTIRLGLSLKPESERTGIVISKPIRFEILKTD